MAKDAFTQTDILLESGTNELEVLVFNIDDGVYGVNVAKVREVIRNTEIVASPSQHSAVRGMFNLRGRLIPLVDLGLFLGLDLKNEPADQKIVVTEFNEFMAAFLVDGVQQIYRMSWEIMRPLPTESNQQHSCFTGIMEIQGQLVLMVDFESVVDSIEMQGELHVREVDNPLGIDRGGYTVFLAEDSNLIRGLMTRTLKTSGYTNTYPFANGRDCWLAIQYLLKRRSDPDTPIPAQMQWAEAPTTCDLLISDIEMPLMDGLHLTRRVKESPELDHMPVVLFSSLITMDTQHKGKQVGADEQISKPRLSDLVHIVDKWVTGHGKTQD